MAYEVQGEYELSTYNKTQKFILQENQGFIEQTRLDEDFFFLKNCVKTNKDEAFYIQGQSSYFVMNYSLYGEMKYHQNATSQSVHTHHGHFTMGLNTCVDGVKTFYKDQDTKSLQLIIGTQNLQKLLPKEILGHLYDNREPFTCLKSAPINAQHNFILSQLFNIDPSQSLNHLLIQSKAYELLHKELTSLKTASDDDKKVRFDAHDKEALFAVLQILKQTYTDPPSIGELSKKVHLNEFKLKYGFKKFFGLPPHAWANEYKMQKAKELLSEDELNVSEIAKLLDYKHVSSFSKSFKKHFGFSPKRFGE